MERVGYLENFDLNINGHLINTTIPQDKPVFVYIFSSMCPACKSFGPVYQQFVKRHPEVVALAIQADGEHQSERDLGSRLGEMFPDIIGYPTVYLFEKNRKIAELEDRSIKGLEKMIQRWYLRHHSFDAEPRK